MSSVLLNNLVDQIHSLPTLPTTFSRVNTLIQRPNTGAGDLAEVISDDQVLTARLLKLVNSAFYGFGGKIKTVSNAIMVLGFKSIKSLVLTSSVLDLFKSKDSNPYFDLQSFWIHSLSVAVACRVLAKHMKQDDPEEWFVAGLLHDIGKLVHHQYLSARFATALKLAFERKQHIHEVEKETLGFSHCETGRMLAERWKLPEELLEPIACHHEPETAAKSPLLTAAVHVGDILARALELGKPGDPIVPRLSPEAWNRLNIPPKAVEGILRTIHSQAEEAQQLLLVSVPLVSVKAPTNEKK